MSSDDRSDTDALFRRVHDEMIDSFDEEFEMELDDERMAKLVTDVTGDLLSQIPYEEIDRAPITLPAPPRRMSWARLLKRVFDIDIEHCPACGGALKIIAPIEVRRRGPMKSSKTQRAGGFHPTPCDGPLCPTGDTVANREKGGGLNFLFARPAMRGQEVPRQAVRSVLRETNSSRTRGNQLECAYIRAYG